MVIGSHPFANRYKREANWAPGKQNAALDYEFLKVVVANWDETTELNFAAFLDMIDQDASTVDNFKKLHRKHRDNIYKILTEGRNAYRSNHEVKKRVDKAVYHHEEGTPPTEYFANQLLRQTLVTHEPLTQSDGIDFEHAVVSLGYAEHVVLDKKWIARIKRFPLPPVPRRSGK